MKKILTTILILIVIALGAFYYFYFWNKTPTDQVGDSNVSTPDFFPFGNSSDVSSTGTNGDSDTGFEDSGTTGAFSANSELSRISEDPVGGFGVFSKTGESGIRFIDKATGHIAEYSENTGLISKITNVTIPKVYESVWANLGNSTIFRYLSEDDFSIKSFYASIKKVSDTDSSGLYSLEGKFLPQNITSLTVSPDESKIFFLTQTNTGSIGTKSNPDGSSAVVILESPIKGLLASWTNKNLITVTTKASSGSDGFAFLLNQNTGIMEKVLSGSGLTTLTSPKGDKILYSKTFGSTLGTFIYDLAKKESSSFPLITLPEKCVWSKQDSNKIFCAVPKSLAIGLPETWYQGKTSFSDEIWMADIKTGSTKQYADLEGATKQKIDAINLTLSKNEGLLYFMNKKDSSLWSLKVGE